MEHLFGLLDRYFGIGGTDIKPDTINRDYNERDRISLDLSFSDPLYHGRKQDAGIS